VVTDFDKWSQYRYACKIAQESGIGMDSQESCYNGNAVERVLVESQQSLKGCNYNWITKKTSKRTFTGAKITGKELMVEGVVETSSRMIEGKAAEL
jgi:hypothetical protein